MSRLVARARWVGLALACVLFVAWGASAWMRVTHWRWGTIFRLDAGVLRLTTTLIDDPAGRLTTERIPPSWQWERRSEPWSLQWLPRTSVWSGGAGRWHVLSLPLWIPLVLVAVPTAWGFVVSRRPKRGQCPKCRYEVGESGGQCPECGHAAPTAPQPAA
ncbi:MAG: hypothetical protein ACKVW3_14290 [Phycisphaerales bacterium]